MFIRFLQLVADHMSIVNDMHGRWSVDIVWDEEKQIYWLIDMATAETSSYYDPEKIKE